MGAGAPGVDRYRAAMRAESPEPEVDRDASIPPHRYTAALAAQIEVAWQDRWEAERTFQAPNPTGPLADGFDQVADRPKLYVLDMFPYPSGAGLHVGHPLGYIGTDVYARYKRMSGHNVLHTMGYDAFGLPAEQYAVQTGTHPRVTTEANIATMRPAPPPRARPTTTAGGRHHRRGLLPLDAVDLPADLRLLVRRRRRPGPPDRRARRRARRGHPRARRGHQPVGRAAGPSSTTSSDARSSTPTASRTSTRRR